MQVSEHDLTAVMLCHQNPEDGLQHCRQEALRLLREGWGKDTTPPQSFFGSIAQVSKFEAL